MPMKHPVPGFVGAGKNEPSLETAINFSLMQTTFLLT
jgi:hypothetical protein